MLFNIDFDLNNLLRCKPTSNLETFLQTENILVHTEIRTLNNVCKYKEVTAKQREYFTLTDSLKSYNEYLDSGLGNIIF